MPRPRKAASLFCFFNHTTHLACALAPKIQLHCLAREAAPRRNKFEPPRAEIDNKDGKSAQDSMQPESRLLKWWALRDSNP
jgi:hypothetical protein